MEFIKCFTCCDLLNENSCQINEEIEELYLELTSINVRNLFIIEKLQKFQTGIYISAAGERKDISNL